MKKERLQELAGIPLLCEDKKSEKRYIASVEKKIREIVSDPDLTLDGKINAIMKHIGEREQAWRKSTASEGGPIV